MDKKHTSITQFPGTVNPDHDINEGAALPEAEPGGSLSLDQSSIDQIVDVTPRPLPTALINYKFKLTVGFTLGFILAAITFLYMAWQLGLLLCIGAGYLFFMSFSLTHAFNAGIIKEQSLICLAIKRQYKSSNYILSFCDPIDDSKQYVYHWQTSDRAASEIIPGGKYLVYTRSSSVGNIIAIQAENAD